MVQGIYDLGYWPLAGLTALTQKAPLKVAYRGAELVGDFMFYTWPQARASSIDNMRHVLGPEAPAAKVREVSHRSFRNFFTFLVDFFRFPRMTRAELEGLAGREFGWEHLDNALRAGNGALLVAPHMGNWELAGIILALRNYPVNTLVRTFRSPRVTRLILEPRIQWGVKVISSDRDIRPLYRALKNNELVGMAFDRPYPETGVAVRFFGDQAYLPAGPAALALRTGARILTGYCVRQRDNNYSGGFYPHIEYQVTGDRNRDFQTITQSIATALEGIIRLYPDQWYMFERLWA